jgi:hypothetical protein
MIERGAECEARGQRWRENGVVEKEAQPRRTLGNLLCLRCPSVLGTERGSRLLCPGRRCSKRDKGDERRDTSASHGSRDSKASARASRLDVPAVSDTCEWDSACVSRRRRHMRRGKSAAAEPLGAQHGPPTTLAR